MEHYVMTYARGEKYFGMKNYQSDFLQFILEDDREFYEHYLSNLTKEEYEEFLKAHPDFHVDVSE